MIAGVLGPPGRSPEEVLRLARDLAGRVGLIELRLDLLDDPDPAPYLGPNRPAPLLVTCRAADEGGAWRGDHPTRLALLQRAIDLGADWVDVEGPFEDRLVRRPGTKVLVSHHDLTGMPEDLPGLARRLASGGADAIKVAGTARRLADVVGVFDFLERADRPPAVALAMGPAGVATRILGPSFGSLWTYAARTPAEASAPGQLSVEEMVEVYRLPRPERPSPILGLAGRPALHSFGPAVHGATLAALGTAGIYLPLETDSIDDALAVARRLGLVGLSVTMPLKEAAFAAAEFLEPGAAALGAVNTLLATEAGWVGANTDVEGVTGPLAEALGDLAGRRVLVLGAGGAARAAVFGLVRAGARVGIANRTRERAEGIARDASAEGDVEAIAWEARLDPVAFAWDALVQATSIGMAPRAEETPIPASALPAGRVVLETIYDPLETRLVREARAAGLTAIRGDRMFLAQARGQLRRWLGSAAPAGTLERALRLERERRARPEGHLYLTGMRGAGKSTLAARLAARWGRPAVDVDREIEAAAGRSIAAIFATEGEAGFRRLEKAALASAARREPSVIALGGGAILDPANAALARETGLVVWLDAEALSLRARLAGDPATAPGRPALSSSGDPLSEIEAILEVRRPIYARTADLRVLADDDPERVLERIVAALAEGPRWTGRT